MNGFRELRGLMYRFLIAFMGLVSAQGLASLGGADLSIVKTASPGVVLPGGSLTFTLVVSNSGPEKALAVQVTDVLPAGFVVTSVAPAGLGCGVLSGSVVCNLPDPLPAGEAVAISISANIPSYLYPGDYGNTATVTSESYDDNLANNLSTAIFSVIAPPRLGNFVWLDLDRDGIQDPGEPGQPDVTVNLYSDSVATPVQSTVTDALGEYQFIVTGLLPTARSVEFVLPAGYAFTIRDQGSDDEADSDADPLTGFSPSITVSANNLTIDAGLIPDVDEDLNHYLSYKIEDGEGPSLSNIEVGLKDQFLDAQFRIKKLVELLNPAEKQINGDIFPINRADLHYLSYDVDGPVFKRQNVEITDQFGTLMVTVKKPERLLVPAAKSLSHEADPTAIPSDASHYLCYRIALDNHSGDDSDDDEDSDSDISGFRKGIEVRLNDQFNQPGLFELKRPMRLCTPVEKNHNGVISPIVPHDEPDHLMCYKVKAKKQEDKKVEGIKTLDQFGARVFDVKEKNELCVPATKVLR